MCILCLCPALAGCGRRGPAVIAGEAMGTTYQVKLIGEVGGLEELEELDAAIAALLESIEAEVSQWRAESWVSRFNRDRRSGEAVAVPGHAWAMLVVAERVYHESGGALDITAGPLVELWGFGARPRDAPPTKHELAEVLSRCGFDKLALDPEAKTLAMSAPGVELDFSSLAKGYAVDRIAGLLDARGVGDYVIAFGGEVRARGNGPGGDGWVVAVERSTADDAAQQQQSVTLRDQSVATSGGGYQHRTLPGGAEVTHLIDPRTGRPMSDAGSSVTVLADRCIDADAWATALSVVGDGERAALAERGGVRWVR